MHVKDVITHLSKTCQHIAGPKDSNDVFPAKVEYQRHCQGVCASRHGFAFVQLQNNLVQALHDVAKRYQKPSQVVQDDILFRMEVVAGGTSHVEHYLVTAVAFGGGPRKPIESYVKLDLVENDPGLLRLAVSPHISPIQTFKERLPTPIVRGSDLRCGSLVSLSTTQLAANLVLMHRNDTLLNQDFVLPDRIVIQRWDYEDETRSILKLKNPSRDWAPVVVTSTPGSVQIGRAHV